MPIVFVLVIQTERCYSF